MNIKQKIKFWPIIFLIFVGHFLCAADPNLVELAQFIQTLKNDYARIHKQGVQSVIRLELEMAAFRHGSLYTNLLRYARGKTADALTPLNPLLNALDEYGVNFWVELGSNQIHPMRAFFESLDGAIYTRSEGRIICFVMKMAARQSPDQFMAWILARWSTLTDTQRQNLRKTCDDLREKAPHVWKALFNTFRQLLYRYDVSEGSQIWSLFYIRAYPAQQIELIDPDIQEAPCGSLILHLDSYL